LIEVECIDPSGYEWILTKGCRYEVDSWHDETIVIKHPTCGIYGLFSSRFKVVGNVELLTLRRYKGGGHNRRVNGTRTRDRTEI
jgi:hypothetical protein